MSFVKFRKYGIISKVGGLTRQLFFIEGSEKMLKAKQIELLEAILANPAMSDVKLGRLLNLNNKTVGKWKRQPEFQEELEKRLKQQWKDAESIAQKAMIDLAIGGDFKASKYILDSLGYAPTQKVETKQEIIEIGVKE